MNKKQVINLGKLSSTMLNTISSPFSPRKEAALAEGWPSGCSDAPAPATANGQQGDCLDPSPARQPESFLTHG